MKHWNYLIYFLVLLPATLFSQNDALYIAGNLSVGKDTLSKNATLFVRGNIIVNEDKVAVFQAGITTLTGDFVNDITNGNVFQEGDTGLVEFEGSATQRIRGSADKSLYYINFPNLRVNNPASVQIVPEMGIEVGTLFLNRGRLTLQSEVTDSLSRQVEMAHLLVRPDAEVIYNRSTESAEEKGIIEVELALGDNYLNKRLVGFSPPFKRIYSDYFTFNYLSKPSPSGLFGDSGSLITSLSYPMNAGEGYLLGQGFIEDEEYYANHLGGQWSESDYEDRYTDKFSFARDFMPYSFGQYNTAEDRFSGEEINTTDVSILLTRQGFNYVGNPYTTPIDLSTFVEETNEIDAWGVTRAADGAGELRNSFYVVSGGTGSYNETTKKYSLTVSYLLGQAVGGTLNKEEYPSFLIAPMQMFIVGKNENGESNLKIPASARSHGHAPFLRSTPAYTDELLIESVDEDTKGYDRLCVVFRESASLESNDRYDATKFFNYSGGVSQIYTRSADGKSMTTNVIPSSARSLELYLQPSDKTREVTLSAYRLYSLLSVSEVWLEDKYRNTWTNLRETPSYTFESAPTDEPDRFVLHFEKQEVGIENPEESSIRAFYHAGKIYLRGLTEQDMNSLVTVTDIQGRGYLRDIIRHTTDTAIECNLPRGIYIINIKGKRNYFSKTIVQ